jgi:hypothetical protein
VSPQWWHFTVKHLASAFNSSGSALAAPAIMNPRIEYWNVPLMRDTAASSGRRISNRVHIVFSSERRAHMTRRDHVVVGWSALSPPPPRDVGTLSGQKKGVRARPITEVKTFFIGCDVRLANT